MSRGEWNLGVVKVVMLKWGLGKVQGEEIVTDFAGRDKLELAIRNTVMLMQFICNMQDMLKSV